MSARRTILNYYRNLIFHLTLILISSQIAFNQSLQTSDTAFAHSAFPSDTTINEITDPKEIVGFYRSDSVFSFRSEKGYFPSLLHNFGEQATAPFHFKAKEWMITGAALGITAALVYYDGDIDAWAKPIKENHEWINKSSPVITEFGNRYGVGIVGVIGTLSAAFNKQKGVQTSLLATQSMITSGAWVQLIKLLTSRERPKGAYLYSQTERGKCYHPFARFDKEVAFGKSNFAFDAFPSGHTALAFSIATVFAERYNNTRSVPVFCYSAATLIGVTRLIEHEHWASDVFAGALIGYICGKQVVKHFNNTHQNPASNPSSKPENLTELTFIQYGNQVGLSLKW
jgi:membrane-associated phospholipid phosphatase